MSRLISCIAAVLLISVAAQPAAAADNDRIVCASGTGDDAITACSRWLERNPRDASAYSARGFRYRDKGDYDRAIADYDQAIRINPKQASAYTNRAAAYNFKGAYDRAIVDLDEAIRIDPKLAGAYNNRGFSYIKKGEYDRAIADLDQALKLSPSMFNAYSHRGYAFGRKGDFAHAMADLTKALALNPIYPEAYTNRAAIHELHGDIDRAIADADEALRLDPRSASAFYWRGNAWFDKARYDRAIADYDEALRLDPGFADARTGRERAQAAVTPRVSPPPAPTLNTASTPKPATAAVATAQPAKRALVIGIDSYPNLGGAAQLERAVADAEAVGDKLAALGFQVTRLTSARQTTLDALLYGFEDFRKTVAKDDMVVLFYAGHGMGLADGTYLVPADVRETSLQVDATARRVVISENELTEGLRQAGASVVVAVIDACRNDLFSRAVHRAAMGNNERGLRPAETEGIFKLYSASEGQTALDRLPGGDGSGNSVFTRVFLKALDTPGLNLSALGTKVRDEVYRLARSADHQQTPAVYDKLIGSTEVYFAGQGKP
jgi:tetratricopeptide (TPR) repeat protein